MHTYNLQCGIFTLESSFCKFFSCKSMRQGNVVYNMIYAFLVLRKWSTTDSPPTPSFIYMLWLSERIEIFWGCCKILHAGVLAGNFRMVQFSPIDLLSWVATSRNFLQAVIEVQTVPTNLRVWLDWFTFCSNTSTYRTACNTYFRTSHYPHLPHKYFMTCSRVCLSTLQLIVFFGLWNSSYFNVVKRYTNHNTV